MRLGLLTDLHLVEDTSRPGGWQNPYHRRGVKQRCRRALELFAAEQVDAVLVLGDLTEDGDLPSLRRALRLCTSDAPSFVVAGNHDGIGRLPRALAAQPGKARAAGVVGRRLGGLRFAGLPITRRAAGRWGSKVRPEVGRWGDDVTVLASHFPVLARGPDLRKAGLKHPGDLVNRGRVEAALAARRRPTIVLSGHLHVRDSAAHGTILQLICGSLIEPPFDASVLTVTRDGGSVSVTRVAHELHEGREQRDPRMVGERERWRFTPRRGWRRA